MGQLEILLIILTPMVVFSLLMFIAWLFDEREARKKISQLKQENTDLRIRIDGLKLTIEEILLTPDGHIKKDRPG